MSELALDPSGELPSVFGDLRGLAVRLGAESLSRHLSAEAGSLRDGVQQALTAAAVLARGIDVRRRAASVDEAALAREIDLLEESFAGSERPGFTRRELVGKEAERIKAKIHEDLEKF